MSPRRPKYPPPTCEVCHSVMNDHSDLTPFRRPGEIQALRICARGTCWDEAAERGYKPA